MAIIRSGWVLRPRTVMELQPLTSQCDLAHRRSVAVLCMLYKIRCNSMHPLYGALPVPYVPVQVTRGAAIAHRFTYTPPRCRTSQCRRAFIPWSVSLWNDRCDPCSMVWDWRVSRAGPINAFYWLTARSLFVSCCFPFLFFHSMGWCCGVGVFGLIGC